MLPQALSSLSRLRESPEPGLTGTLLATGHSAWSMLAVVYLSSELSRQKLTPSLLVRPAPEDHLHVDAAYFGHDSLFR